MSRRALLLAGGGAVTNPGAPLPPDPTLSEYRVVTATGAINQNVTTVVTSQTVEHELEAFVEDCNGFRLLFHGVSQGSVDDPTRLFVSVRLPSGEWEPVTFGGKDYAEISPETTDESDLIEGVYLQGTSIRVRVFVEAGTRVNVGRRGRFGTGDQRFVETFTRNSEYDAEAPYPLVIHGRSRAGVVAPGLFGDSISAGARWWSSPLAARGMPGANYGRNVMRFDGRWLNAEAVRGVTHMLVQFGVNDLGAGPSVATLWAAARACYTYLDGLKPGLPIYQTTPTPTVGDTAGDGCATLAGQTLDEPRSTARQTWIAWQRDGMPFDVATGEAVAIGAAGTRIGEEGHPILGLVDVAAHVEHGGLVAPSGKWRVDQGALGGDGVHPFDGHPLMQVAVSEWLSTLVAASGS